MVPPNVPPGRDGGGPVREGGADGSADGRAYLSEFLGTYLLVFTGPASVILTSFFAGQLGTITARLIVAGSFGGTVAAAILAFGQRSGAHINPAVTVAHALADLSNRRPVILYVTFQTLGGLLAGATLRVLFASVDSTGNLGSTELTPGIGPIAGATLEAAGTFALSSSALLAFARLRGRASQAGLVGGTLFLLIILIGPLTGASFNPARSLGPSLASGYFREQYVYVVGPIVGGSVAGFTFRLLSMKGRGHVLFVCVENAGRSQMAEAFAKEQGLSATSAGTFPAKVVNALVVQAMKEKGVDLSMNVPKLLTAQMIEDARLVVTMGCSVEEVCPAPMLARMQKKLIDWNLEDPKGRSIDEVRKIRDEIERRVVELAGRMR